MSNHTATSIAQQNAQVEVFLRHQSHQIYDIFNQEAPYGEQIDRIKSILFDVFKAGYTNKNELNLMEPDELRLDADAAAASYQAMRALYGEGFVTDPNK